MSYIQVDGATVQVNDEQRDAFGRIRVSELFTIFEAKYTYGTEEGLFFTNPNGAGSITFLPYESAFLLTVGTNAGDSVIRETYRSFVYQPGKSQYVLMTGVLGAPVNNVVQQIGYFDNNDGVFFEQTSTGMFACLLSSVTGVPVKTAIPQSNWNRDKLDGTGPSGITLDTSKAQIFVFDLQWLGVGRVRYGFNIGGNIIYCHEINNANSADTTYMRTAQLPLRYAITNVGVTAAATSMRQICCSIAIEGGYDAPGALYSFRMGDTPVYLPLNTNTPIMSFRLRPVVAGTSNRSIARLQSLDIMPSVNRPTYFSLVLNATLTGSNFQPTSFPGSVVDVDTSTTSFSGGEERYAGILSERMDMKDVAGNIELIPGAIFTLVMRPIVTPMSVWASINWREIN